MSTILNRPRCGHQIPLETHIPISPSFRKPSSFVAFSLRQNVEHLVCTSLTRCSLDRQPMGCYPRPSEVQWKKELCNTVQLIGIVALPVQLTHLSSGKVVASTRLAVRKSATDTSWINVTFWDELAHIANQHVEKGHQICVSGRLVSDTVEGEDGKQLMYYKVVVQQLNFVERNPPPVALYDGNSTSAESVGRSDNVSANRNSPQELWQAFFTNPEDWWDNRKNKKNPRYPDFKHKDTGEALWVESKYNPSWVKSQIEILDSRLQAQSQDDVAFQVFE